MLRAQPSPKHSTVCCHCRARLAPRASPSDRPSGRALHHRTAHGGFRPCATHQADVQQRPPPPRLLKFCTDSKQELRLLTWGCSGLLLGLTALASLSEATEKAHLSDQASLLPDTLFAVHSALQACWHVYDDAVYMYPLATKGVISGLAYGLGDLTAQTLDRPAHARVDWARTARSLVIGAVAHGPLSSLYFDQLDRQFIISRTFNHAEAWYVPLLKIAIDQTLWSMAWNTIFFILQGTLKGRSPVAIAQSVQRTWLPLLTGGWRIWPLAHLVTFCFVPLPHRVLWVDSVELAWVSIVSLHTQQEAERQQAALTVDSQRTSGDSQA